MRTFLDLDPQDAGGAQEGARPGRRGTQGTRCPPYTSPTPRKGQRRRPPSDSRRGRPGRRGTQWARGPRRRPRLGCRKGKGNGRRAEGEGGRGGPAARRAGGRGTRLPHRRPNKDAGGTRARALPGWPGARRGGGGRLAPPSGREAPSWAGGEIPGLPHAGKSPLPAATRAANPARDGGHPAGPRPPQPAAAAAAALGSRGRRGEGGDATEGKVGFGSVSFYRVGCAPVHAGARVGRASGVPRGPGQAGRALRSQGPSPRLGPGSAARPLLPPPARPLAHSLAPGAWIDLVALASGSRSRPASTPQLPIPGALARPPAL